MNIHEYQAKVLLAKFAVPLLKGGVAYTKDEAMDVARKLGGPVTVVKAQIHAGGRGKGGGGQGRDGLASRLPRCAAASGRVGAPCETKRVGRGTGVMTEYGSEK